MARNIRSTATRVATKMAARTTSAPSAPRPSGPPVKNTTIPGGLRKPIGIANIAKAGLAKMQQKAAQQSTVTPNEATNYLPPDVSTGSSPGSGGGGGGSFAPEVTTAVQPQVKTAGSNLGGVLFMLAIVGGLIWYGRPEQKSPAKSK